MVGPANSPVRSRPWTKIKEDALRKITTIIIGAALAVGGVFATVATVTSPSPTAWNPPVDRPWCPTEDSCTPNYDGDLNVWVVREDR